MKSDENKKSTNKRTQDTASSIGRFAFETAILLDKRGAAELLQCTTRTLENYMRDGLVPYLKLGRTVKFNRDDVISHLQENCRVVRCQRQMEAQR